MLVAWTLVVAFAGAPAVDSICPQVAPAKDTWARTANRARAVLLIHGFHYHFTDAGVARAALRPWQVKDSPLVKELGKDADVFSLAYGQNVPLDVIVKESKLASSVAELKKLGYSEIVLIGHSAGGLIARQFVEDNPSAGVAKVLQICSPNAGSALAELGGTKSQKPFLRSLTPDFRKKLLEARKDKRIPEKVQFLCVVARTGKGADSDSIVLCESQWTPDLHKQGIPAVGVFGVHREVVRDAKLAVTLAGLVRDSHPRWSAERVEQGKKEILAK
ncbi:MAG: hypothetical protein FJ303_04090 [Planctomycetes bacterium]|nr:hypothetical protein [Planctomycetota bacterium]